MSIVKNPNISQVLLIFELGNHQLFLNQKHTCWVHWFLSNVAWLKFRLRGARMRSFLGVNVDIHPSESGSVELIH